MRAKIKLNQWFIKMYCRKAKKKINGKGKHLTYNIKTNIFLGFMVGNGIMAPLVGHFSNSHLKRSNKKINFKLVKYSNKIWWIVLKIVRLFPDNFACLIFSI